jgi:hypothetical protein
MKSAVVMIDKTQIEHNESVSPLIADIEGEIVFRRFGQQQTFPTEVFSFSATAGTGFANKARCPSQKGTFPQRR